jgi:hypothetical protein
VGAEAARLTAWISNFMAADHRASDKMIEGEETCGHA